MDKVKPKKALGQHFLTDEPTAARIAATLDSVARMPTVEVGPGMGMLTKYLLERQAPLKVVEVDGESIEWLNAHYPALHGNIIDGDFLKLNLNELFPDAEKIAVIGNYPYNISSQIFFHVLDYKDRVEVCSGMLQREVAERLAAPEGTKARGILSVLLQSWFDVEYLFTVSENVFNPPPKVKSGVVKLTRNAVTDLGCDERLFKIVVKTTFGQRRKTLRNSVRPLIPAEKVAALADNPMMGLRPEQLSVAQFIELTNFIASLR
ncbi:MAG: 16S rRNA (adenine(1518)-N(6)/adenine(1519)-N(6))-dimethyltransferase RsmA [Muribaculaceae bacterium]|nr:16S rRNA (adenine(1518)-N(6)/adenine(1519)-N(6))-dimethyltransferase RsmA [Muribaculaceae bacterium]